jgi:hypothetical protein
MCPAFSGSASGMNSSDGVSRTPSCLPTSLRSMPVAAFSAAAVSSRAWSSPYGVEHRRVLQVARDAHVGDRHEAEPRIAQPLLEPLGDEHADAVGEPRLPFVRHGSSLGWTEDAASSGRGILVVMRSAAGLLHHLGRLDLVADLDVVVLAEADTGLEVRADLGDVVLEATQRLDGQAVGETTPSRMTRALALRVIVPERTMTPAMLPNFEERNTSRISATPDCTSSNSGLSRPLSDCSTSSIAL